MKKIDWNAPVSRKDYAVLCGWSLGIVTVFWIVGMGITYWEEIKKWTVSKAKKIRSKLPW